MVTQVSNKKLLELLTLSLTKKGNKHVAELIVSDLFLVLRKQYKVFPYTTLHQAVDKVKPLTGFRNVKLRGSSYKIPFFLRGRPTIKNGPFLACFFSQEIQVQDKHFFSKRIDSSVHGSR
jgi:ribosomal protein S7